MTSAFHFKNGIRFLVTTTGNHISSKVCDHNWNPVKDYAECPLDWSGRDEVGYHKRIRSLHASEDLVTDKSTILDESPLTVTSIKKTGIELIAEERQRQADVEGWNNFHDEDHTAYQLSAAAGCYIASAQNKYFLDHTHSDGKPVTRFQVRDEGERKWVDGWPWDKEYDKREKHDIKRSLVIAGALIAAEIDRLNNE